MRASDDGRRICLGKWGPSSNLSRPAAYVRALAGFDPERDCRPVRTVVARSVALARQCLRLEVPVPGRFAPARSGQVWLTDLRLPAGNLWLPPC